MALEVASVLPPQANVLDVGCGNGFIAHHLQGLLGKPVVGLDVGKETAARCGATESGRSDLAARIERQRASAARCAVANER